MSHPRPRAGSSGCDRMYDWGPGGFSASSLPPSIPTGTAAQATDRRQPTLRARWSPAVASADARLDSSPWKGTHCPPRLWGQGGKGRGPGAHLAPPSLLLEIRRPGICSKSSHPAAHFIDSARATAPRAPPAPSPSGPKPPPLGSLAAPSPLPAPGPTLSLQASGRAGVWRGLCDSAAAESPGLSVN